MTAALQIKNIPTGAGDTINIDATYAKGAPDVISTSAASPNFAMFGNTGRAGAYQSLGFGATTDAVFFGAPPAVLRHRRSAEADDGWGVRGAYNHNWDPYWSPACSAAMLPFTVQSVALTSRLPRAWVAQAHWWLATKSADFAATRTSTLRSLASVTRWTPVKNLTFSAEVLWFHLDQKFSGVRDPRTDRLRSRPPCTSSRTRTPLP